MSLHFTPPVSPMETPTGYVSFEDLPALEGINESPQREAIETDGISPRGIIRNRGRGGSTLHGTPMLSPKDADSRRTIGWVGVAALVYFNVSGGPYGSEGLISALGPLPGLIAVIVFPLIWAFPLSLITAELSTSFPENGGYTIWVSEAFGEFFGFQEGYWSWISGVVDNAVYPVLALNYMLQAPPTSLRLTEGQGGEGRRGGAGRQGQL
jgi:hypothetical protein